MSSHFKDEMNVVFKFLVVSVFLGPNCRPAGLFKDLKNPVSLSGIVQAALREAFRVVTEDLREVKIDVKKTKQNKTKGLGH